MEKYSVGVKKAQLGDFDPVTGAISNLVEVEVYKDTLTITEDAPTATKHFQSGKNSPRKITYVGGSEMAEFSIMNTSAASMALGVGGVATTVSGRGRWSKAKGTIKERIKALVVTSDDDFVYTITRGSTTGVKKIGGGDSNIALIQMKIEATDTGLDNVPDVTWDEPEVPEEE